MGKREMKRATPWQKKVPTKRNMTSSTLKYPRNSTTRSKTHINHTSNRIHRYTGTHPYTNRLAAETNLQKAREAITTYSNSTEMDVAIWQSIRKNSICLRIQRFLYKPYTEA
jgi:hypothetical protein